jgi:putative transposase
MVVVEDLQITNMVRSAKGTIDHPGVNVAQKAGLNRSIAGEAWGRTVTLLEYKTRDRGSPGSSPLGRGDLGATRSAKRQPPRVA